MQTPCLQRNGKKNPLELRLRSVVKTIWASDFFSFSVVAACLQNGLMIKKYHWNTAFYASNFQDFQKFPGRCPEPRLGGLQRPPRPPAGLRGASRPAAQSAACTLFSKNLSQTTLGLWPATPLRLAFSSFVAYLKMASATRRNAVLSKTDCWCDEKRIAMNAQQEPIARLWSSQLLLIQPTTNAKGSLNRSDNKSSAKFRFWLCKTVQGSWR